MTNPLPPRATATERKAGCICSTMWTPSEDTMNRIDDPECPVHHPALPVREPEIDPIRDWIERQEIGYVDFTKSTDYGGEHVDFTVPTERAPKTEADLAGYDAPEYEEARRQLAAHVRERHHNEAELGDKSAEWLMRWHLADHNGVGGIRSHPLIDWSAPAEQPAAPGVRLPLARRPRPVFRRLPALSVQHGRSVGHAEAGPDGA